MLCPNFPLSELSRWLGGILLQARNCTHWGSLSITELPWGICAIKPATLEGASEPPDSSSQRAKGAGVRIPLGFWILFLHNAQTWWSVLALFASLSSQTIFFHIVPSYSLTLANTMLRRRAGSYQIGEDVCIIGWHHPQLSCLQCKEKTIRERHSCKRRSSRVPSLLFIWPTSPKHRQCRGSWLVLKWLRIL